MVYRLNLDELRLKQRGVFPIAVRRPKKIWKLKLMNALVTLISASFMKKLLNRIYSKI